MSDLVFTADKDHPVPVEEKGGQLRVSRDDLAQLVIALSYWGYSVWVSEQGEEKGMVRLRYFRQPVQKNPSWWQKLLGR